MGYSVPEIIKRDSRQEVRVTGDVEDNSRLMEVSLAVKNAVSELELPESVTLSFKGKAKEDSKARTKVLMAFFFAVFLVYGVMTIQFGSFFMRS